MVCLGRVGFALSVVVVLEFDTACWAVCDAHGLCPCEYLFSELFVFSGACSAHRYSSSFFLFSCWCWVVARRSLRRDERLHRPNTTLLFSLSSLVVFLLFFVFLLFWNGGCRVVRAQPCEHARNTTRALCFLVCCLGFVLRVYHHDTCLLSLPHTVHS